MSCNICCENYNKSNHTKIICNYNDCNFECCKTCIRTYILNTTNEPHCMNCKNIYNQEFLIKNLNKSFIENDYKNHRKTLLLEKEIAKTQELMPLVSKTIEIEEYKKKLNIILSERKELRDKLNKLDLEIKNINRSINNLKNSTDIENERKQFILPCPADNCKGYLSNKYKCGICNLYTCPDCLEIIGYNKEEQHTCNPDSVKSREAIKSETKPCPKCGVRIFKIIGCDQMWCTECKVAFSWRSGNIIITNNIHNPHFYEYMKKQNNNTDIRNPGDVLCGGLIRYDILNIIIRCINNENNYLETSYICKYKNTIYSKNTNISGLLYCIHRIMTHFNNIDLINIRHKVAELSDHNDLTIKYIRNIISKNELANNIIRADNNKKKSNQILHIYELISIVSIEGFNSLYNKFLEFNKKNTKTCFSILYNECVKFIEQFNYIVNYSNLQLGNISYNYSLSVLQIYINYNINDISEKIILKWEEKYRIYKMRFSKVNLLEMEKYNENFKYIESSQAGPSKI